MQQLIVLGTGAAIISKYYNTCFALFNGEEYFLVDGGGGSILRQFDLAGIDWHKMHHIFISHAHTDHIFGVVWALRKLTHMMQQQDFEGDVFLYGHQEVLDKVKTICALTLSASQMARLQQQVVFTAVTHNQQRTINGYGFTFFDVFSDKVLEYGFHLVLPSGDTLVFLGDEPFHEKNRSLVQNCTWLLSEAYCLERDRSIFNPHQHNHNTVKETCAIAQQLAAKNLIIWHTEDRTFGEKAPLYLKEGQLYYHGNLLIPEDLAVIQLD